MEEQVQIEYSMSAGLCGDGKSVCLWRTVGAESEKIARFQSESSARKFAEEFDFPLSDDLKCRLEEANGGLPGMEEQVSVTLDWCGSAKCAFRPPNAVGADQRCECFDSPDATRLILKVMRLGDAWRKDAITLAMVRRALDD